MKGRGGKGKDKSSTKNVYEVGDVVLHGEEAKRCGIVHIHHPGSQLPTWITQLGPAESKGHLTVEWPHYLIRGPTLLPADQKRDGLWVQFCPKRHYAWVGEKTLSKADVYLNDFPILSLPLPVLAGVFRRLPVFEGAFLCLTCKKFVAAFRDEATWKQRCAEESVRLGIPVDLSNPTTSYFLTFKERFVWWIEVVTLFTHRGGRSLSGRFTCSVFPTMTVKSFEELITNDPSNRQRSAKGLTPHNPAVLGSWNHPIDPSIQPNCQYDNSDPNATIASVGLCDGAVLQLPERMMRD